MQISDDPLVDACWSAQAPARFLLLPDGCLDVVERGGQLEIVGPMTRARWVDAHQIASRGIRFRPGAVRSWLGLPLGALRDAVVPLRDCPLPAHILHSPRRDAAVPLLSRLARHARAHLRRDPRIVQAGHRLLQHPDLALGPLARELGWTTRHLRRRFEAEIGLAPRHFARIARLRRLTALLPGEASLSDLAYRCAFADQAHLCREVRALVGLSPTALRQHLRARRASD